MRKRTSDYLTQQVEKRGVRPRADTEALSELYNLLVTITYYSVFNYNQSTINSCQNKRNKI